MNKIILICTCLTALLMTSAVRGDEIQEELDGTIGVEVRASQMLIARDGSGVIKNISCYGCTTKTLTITPATRSFVNGVRTDTFDAKAANLKNGAAVRFDPNNNEVVSIRW